MANSWSPLPTSAWPSTALRGMFFYDTNQPSTLEASVVNAKSGFETLLITCGASCASAELPQQTITHISGSSWAGRHTLSHFVTSWGCNLGSGTDDVLTDQSGWCSAATAAEDGKLELGTRTPVNGCFVMQRSELVTITGGVEKHYSYEPPFLTPGSDSLMGPADYSSAWQSSLSTMHCSATTTTSAAASRTSEASESTATTRASDAPSRTGTEAASSSETGASANLSLSRALFIGSAVFGILAHV